MIRRVKQFLDSQNPMLIVGVLLTTLVAIAAIFAPYLAPYDPVEDANLMNSLRPPGEDFLLGTDRQGRDILSRLIFGTRIALLVGIVSQGLNTLIGVLLGASAGLFGGKVDDSIMAFTNMVLSIPPLILALAIMTVLGPGLINILIALGFTQWTYTCRICRAQILSVKEQDFVEAADALGASRFRIALKHILPHVFGPVFVIASLGVGAAILLEASLSFLGVGTQPPTPSWGTMLSSGRTYIWTAPWITISPGVAIMITVLGVNLIGDGLRDKLDPRVKRELDLSD